MTDKIFLEEWNDDFSELGKDAKGNSSKVLKLKKETDKAVRAFQNDFSRKYEQRISQLQDSLGVDLHTVDNHLIYDGTGRRAIRLDSNMYMTTMRNKDGLNRIDSVRGIKDVTEKSIEDNSVVVMENNNVSPSIENEISSNVSNIVDRKMEEVKEEKQSGFEEFKVTPITNFEKREVPQISDISINVENTDSLQGVNEEIFNRNTDEEKENFESSEEEVETEYTEEENEHKEDISPSESQKDDEDNIVIPEDRSNVLPIQEDHLEKTFNSIVDIQNALDDYEKNKDKEGFSKDKVAEYIRQKQDELYDAKQYLTEREETILREKIKSIAPSTSNMTDNYVEDDEVKDAEEPKNISENTSTQEEKTEEKKFDLSDSLDVHKNEEVEKKEDSSEISIPKDELARMIDMANTLNKQKEEVEKESENITELLVEKAKEEENNYAKMRDNVLKELKDYINSTKEAIDKRKADNEARNNSYDEALKNKDRYQKEIDMMLKSMGKESTDTNTQKR